MKVKVTPSLLMALLKPVFPSPPLPLVPLPTSSPLAYRPTPTTSLPQMSLRSRTSIYTLLRMLYDVVIRLTFEIIVNYMKCALD